MFSYLSRDARVTLQIEDHEFGKESSRNEPFSITLYIIRNAASIEDMIRAVTSTNRAHHKAVAKYQAKQMQALSKLATNEESKVFVANAVTMIREGRQDDLLKKFVDLTENAAALEYFGPVQSVIDKHSGREMETSKSKSSGRSPERRPTASFSSPRTVLTPCTDQTALISGKTSASQLTQSRRLRCAPRTTQLSTPG